MLAGRGFFSGFRSMFAWLDSPLATFFVCSSAFVLGGKSLWPGIHCIHCIRRSKTPLEHTISGLPVHLVCLNVARL